MSIRLFSVMHLYELHAFSSNQQFYKKSVFKIIKLGVKRPAPLSALSSLSTAEVKNV